MEMHGPSPVNDGSFMLRLAMAAGHCPVCGEAAEPGSCQSCGAEVPPAEGPSEYAVARNKALSSLVRRASEMRRRWQEDLAPGPKVTADQLAGAFVQSEVLERLDHAEQACQRLSCLDFDDKAALGTSVRAAVVGEVDLIEEVGDLCREIASLDVHPPQPELLGELLDAARRVEDMLLRLLETLSAQTIEEARRGEKGLQEAISQGPRAADLQPTALELFASADVDARVALAVGRPGSYLDASGFIDIGRVFGAYSGEEGPYERLARASAEYFRHLLPEDPDPSAGTFLILAAVNIASLNGPIRAHRCAKAMAELVGQAAALDSEAVSSVFERSVAEGPKLFAAASRVRMGMQLIRHASEMEAVEDELILREVMSSYLEITESAFRSHAWAMLEMQAVIDGKAPNGGDPPTLGSLLQRLRASPAALARDLADTTDADLRNAAGHSQYRWDRQAEEVEDLKTGQRWGVDDLEARTEALSDSVLGLDAGYLCGLIAAGIDFAAPREEVDPTLRALLVEAAFAVAGYELAELSQDSATASIRVDAEASLPALMTAVASMSALVKGVNAYRVMSADSGRALIDVAAERMLAATSGPEETRDLEIVRCFTDSEIRTGAPAADALFQSLVVQAKVVAATALQSLLLDGPTAEVAAKIRIRVEAVLELASDDPNLDLQATQVARRHLQRIVANTYSLERGQPKAFDALLRGIRATLSWADRQGISWPPEGERD
jgi:hypothetical protein